MWKQASTAWLRLDAMERAVAHIGDMRLVRASCDLTQVESSRMRTG